MAKGRYSAEDQVSRPNGLLSTRQLVELTDISKGQLEKWIVNGWVKPDRGGQGTRATRYWDPSWVEIIRDMVDRVDSCPYSHRLERKK